MDDGPQFNQSHQPNIIEAYKALQLCQSANEFILTSLSHAFGMNQGQSAALLANHQKSLHYINVRGFRGYDYSMVLHWYELIMQSSQIFAKLVSADPFNKEVIEMSLNVFKFGLFSEDAEVVILCAKVLNRICGVLLN